MEKKLDKIMALIMDTKVSLERSLSHLDRKFEELKSEMKQTQKDLAQYRVECSQRSEKSDKKIDKQNRETTCLKLNVDIMEKKNEESRKMIQDNSSSISEVRKELADTKEVVRKILNKSENGTTSMFLQELGSVKKRLGELEEKQGRCMLDRGTSRNLLDDSPILIPMSALIRQLDTEAVSQSKIQIEQERHSNATDIEEVCKFLCPENDACPPSSVIIATNSFDLEKESKNNVEQSIKCIVNALSEIRESLKESSKINASLLEFMEVNVHHHNSLHKNNSTYFSQNQTHDVKRLNIASSKISSSSNDSSDSHKQEKMVKKVKSRKKKRRKKKSRREAGCRSSDSENAYFIEDKVLPMLSEDVRRHTKWKTFKIKHVTNSTEDEGIGSASSEQTGNKDYETQKKKVKMKKQGDHKGKNTDNLGSENTHTKFLVLP